MIYFKINRKMYSFKIKPVEGFKIEVKRLKLKFESLSFMVGYDRLSINILLFCSLYGFYY